jgi:hexosaminidase
MLLPRLLALSEVLWSSQEARSWDGFVARLPLHFPRLDALGVEYRVPGPIGIGWDRLELQDRFRVTMRPPFTGALIRYTTDGSDPTIRSPRYTGPFDLHLTPSPTTVSARVFLPSGRASPVARARIASATWHESVAVRGEDLQPGLSYAYIEGVFRASDEVKGGTPARVGTVPDVSLRGDERAEDYGVRLTGLLCVPSDALYTFYFSSDDGAKLRIDNALIVDRDGPQRESEKPGQIALRAGCHPIEVVFFQASGAAGLHLEISTGELSKRSVPARWYVHLAGTR